MKSISFIILLLFFYSVKGQVISKKSFLDQTSNHKTFQIAKIEHKNWVDFDCDELKNQYKSSRDFQQIKCLGNKAFKLDFYNQPLKNSYSLTYRFPNDTILLIEISDRVNNYPKDNLWINDKIDEDFYNLCINNNVSKIQSAVSSNSINKSLNLVSLKDTKIIVDYLQSISSYQVGDSIFELVSETTYSHGNLKCDSNITAIKNLSKTQIKNLIHDLSNYGLYLDDPYTDTWCKYIPHDGFLIKNTSNTPIGLIDFCTNCYEIVYTNLLTNKSHYFKLHNLKPSDVKSDILKSMILEQENFINKEERETMNKYNNSTFYEYMKYRLKISKWWKKNSM